MRRKTFAWGVALLAVMSCGDASGVAEPETDSPLPQRDAADAGMLPQLPAAAPERDAGYDAGHAPMLAAADGGRPDRAIPDPPAPTEPKPPAPLPLTLSFDPPGGGFEKPFELSLHATDPAAQVHFTLDGSVPSASSPVATAPVPIAKSTLVRALVTRGAELGPITNQAFFQLDTYARDFRSDLPVIVIDMQNGPLPDTLSMEKVSAVLGVFEPKTGTTQLAQSASLTSRAGIKVRGRSTRYQEKHSYTFELWGVNKEDAPAALLGMPEDGDWVLYAPYVSDRSLMHNAFGYAVSRRIGRYAPRTSYCEVFLVSGGAGVTQASYAGIYVLTERISRGAQRVPVKKLHPEDLTEPMLSGGYIIQANAPDTPDEGFDAAGKRFLFVHPNQDDVQPAQTQYISSYLDSVMRAASAADGVDAMSGKHYSDLIDVPAFIDHHILNVLVKNPDAFALSSYFYKDRADRLVAGPLWDLDLGMAAEDPWGQRSIDPTQWSPSGENYFDRSFWAGLFTHEEFVQAYWTRWRELLAGPFAASQLQTVVDELARQLTQAEPRNRARWPASAPRNDSFADEAGALRAWLSARVTWIAANVGKLP